MNTSLNILMVFAGRDPLQQIDPYLVRPSPFDVGSLVGPAHGFHIDAVQQGL
jgi:hypothetical protein